MQTLLLLVVLMFQGGQVVTQGGPPPEPVPKDAPKTLPDTPQGQAREGVHRGVQFRRRDDVPQGAGGAHVERCAGASGRRRIGAKMFNRMKGDFGKLR